jgi:ribosomal RNA-processing protein 12
MIIDDLSPQMLDEIFTTSLVFLDSANREIVKSALGFVKLAIHSYPTEVIEQHMRPSIKLLLGWSHGHKNHFKLKVRYICERMIRKFGFEAVFACAEGEDGKKVLLNIKKRKEHARKKKQAAAADEDEEVGNSTTIVQSQLTIPKAEATSKPATGAAFEDVLYGSESESEAGDSDGGETQNPQKRNQPRGARLRVDDDEPMDLLEGAATRVTSMFLAFVFGSKLTKTQMLAQIVVSSQAKTLPVSRPTRNLESLL